MADVDHIEGNAAVDGSDEPGSGLRERIVEHGYDELLFLEPSEYDDAIVGVAEAKWDSAGHRDDVVVYDLEQVIEIAHQMCGGEAECAREEAVEHVYYNILGGYHGRSTPIFVRSRDWFLRE